MPTKRNLSKIAHTNVSTFSSKKSKRKKNKRLKNNYYVREELVEGLFQYNHSNNNYESNNSFQPKEEIKPRTENQHIYSKYLNNKNVSVVACVGPAGTGKTLLATVNGINQLKENLIDKIIITRPLVSADEDIGYLPGNLEDKMAPWTRPMMDIFYDYFDSNQIEYMINEKIIEICPLAYMRGRTFKNSWIIADEMQNATINQMKMILTRIGNGSKMIITGDLLQHDRKNEINGLADFMDKLKNSNSTLIKCIRFNDNDIKRHKVVKEIINLYR
jgi:phosphate starvation-inducible protein PhoH